MYNSLREFNLLPWAKYRSIVIHVYDNHTPSAVGHVRRWLEENPGKKEMMM